MIAGDHWTYTFASYRRWHFSLATIGTQCALSGMCSGPNQYSGSWLAVATNDSATAQPQAGPDLKLA